MRSVRWVITCTLLLLAAPAGAVSLGEIEVKSTLNQHFRAEIPVSGIPEKKNLGLRADIASPAAFKRAGLRRESLYDDMVVDLVPGLLPDEARIIIKSTKRIGEPFLSFLIELKWVSGSVIREYTVLLDPATYKPPASVTAEAEVGSGSARYPASRSGRASAGSSSYGPVGNETLWRIAYKLRPDTSITMDQMQLAIYEANPQAFDGDINHIRKGSMLVIPSADEIRQINPATATAKVRGRTPSRRYASQPARARPARRAPVAAEPVDTLPPPVETEISPPPAATGTVAEPAPELIRPEPAPAAPNTPPPALAPDAAPTAPPAPAAEAAPPPVASADQMVDPDESAIPPAPVPAEGVAAEEAAPLTDAAQEASAPAVDATPVPVPTAPAAAPTPAAPAAETGGDAFALIKPLLLVLLVAGGALAGLRYYRQRKAREEAEAEAAVAQLPEFAPDDLEAPVPAASAPMWQGEQRAAETRSPATTTAPSAPAPPRAPALDLDELFATPPPSATITRTSPEVRTTGGAGTTTQLPAEEIPVKDTDYIGEAELHIAYGLYDEAATVLERGVQENPKRNDLWMKLLDVYAEAKNSDDYLAAAERFRQQGQPTEAEWQKVTAQGATLAPGAALGAAPAPAAAAAAPARSEAPAKAAAPSDVMEFDLSQFDLPATPAPTPAPSAPAPAASATQTGPSVASRTEGLDIDLSGFDLGATAEAKPTAPAAKPPASDTALADSLEFKLDTPAAGAPAAGTDMGALDALAPDLKPAAVGDDEESGVKLDLARAYLDMGEADMARGLLEEVVKAGSAQQRTEAKDLLARV